MEWQHWRWVLLGLGRVQQKSEPPPQGQVTGAVWNLHSRPAGEAGPAASKRRDTTSTCRAMSGTAIVLQTPLPVAQLYYMLSGGHTHQSWAGLSPVAAVGATACSSTALRAGLHGDHPPLLMLLLLLLRSDPFYLGTAKLWDPAAARAMTRWRVWRCCTQRWPAGSCACLMRQGCSGPRRAEIK